MTTRSSSGRSVDSSSSSERITLAVSLSSVRYSSSSSEASSVQMVSLSSSEKFSSSSETDEVSLLGVNHPWITTHSGVWEGRVEGSVWKSPSGEFEVNCPGRGSGSDSTDSVPSLIGG